MCNVAFNRQSVCVDVTSICWTHIGMKLLSCEETRGFLFEDPHTYLQILPHFTLLPIVFKSFYTLHVLATYYNSYFQIFPPVEWNDFTLCCKLILFFNRYSSTVNSINFSSSGSQFSSTHPQMPANSAPGDQITFFFSYTRGSGKTKQKWCPMVKIGPLC